MGAAVSRRDMRGLHKPSMVEVMPRMMINNVVMKEVRRIASSPQSARVIIS
jgi:hypothetical protein